MKLAIMQPYVFPYIGYFQLVAAVDKFVIYDDVNFIKRGWINRNNVLLNKSKTLFTIPLDKASQFTLINETKINLNLYDNWKLKFLTSIKQSYKKAPYYKETYDLIESVLSTEKEDSISKLAVNSIKSVSEYLDIDTEICETSSIYNNNNLSGCERILDICKVENCSHYINPIGGMDLYSKDLFEENNIVLNFIKAQPIEYVQFANDFAPWLSIIDVLMFNSKEDLKRMINQYELV